jgi:phosphoribosylamine--glycine ligase
LRSELAEIFQAIVQGSLADINVDWTNESSACVVLASRGYPGKYQTSASISGINLSGSEQVEIFHAGTSLSADGALVTAGGRVLGVTATGSGLDEALSRCYNAIAGIHWDGMLYRRDIGRFENASGGSHAGEISDRSRG